MIDYDAIVELTNKAIEEERAYQKERFYKKLAKDMRKRSESGKSNLTINLVDCLNTKEFFEEVKEKLDKRFVLSLLSLFEGEIIINWGKKDGD